MTASHEASFFAIKLPTGGLLDAPRHPKEGPQTALLGECGAPVVTFWTLGAATRHLSDINGNLLRLGYPQHAKIVQIVETRSYSNPSLVEPEAHVS